MPAEEVLAWWLQAISQNGDATVDYGYEGDRRWFACKQDGGP